MSKCQKNKYAAGGKCGSMSSLGPESRGQNPEINGSFQALLASREKQDLLFSSPKPETQPKAPAAQQAIVLKKVISKSDIDTVLEGDF